VRFTTQQYDEAIENLRLAKEQLEPDGNSCSICTDSGHMAFECGSNPLVAMVMCEQIAKGAEQLHEMLHTLAGFNFHMGVQLGPRRINVPDGEEPTFEASPEPQISGWEIYHDCDNDKYCARGPWRNSREIAERDFAQSAPQPPAASGEDTIEPTKEDKPLVSRIYQSLLRDNDCSTERFAKWVVAIAKQHFSRSSERLTAEERDVLGAAKKWRHAYVHLDDRDNQSVRARETLSDAVRKLKQREVGHEEKAMEGLRE
jgi:hypothetical protein